jgi:hypothetical protein
MSSNPPLAMICTFPPKTAYQAAANSEECSRFSRTESGSTVYLSSASKPLGEKKTQRIQAALQAIHELSLFLDTHIGKGVAIEERLKAKGI